MSSRWWVGDFETRAVEGARLREAMAERARWMLGWRREVKKRPDGVRIDGEPSLATAGQWFPFEATDGARGRVMIKLDSAGEYRFGSMTIEVEDDETTGDQGGGGRRDGGRAGDGE